MEAFPIQNGLKQDAVSPSPFNFAIECVIRKVHKNQAVLQLCGMHQPLIYVDDDNVLYLKLQIMNEKCRSCIRC